MVKKKWIGLLLLAAMVFTLLPTEALAAEAAVIDSSVQVTVQGYSFSYTGTGTREDPYYCYTKYNSSKKAKIEIAAINPNAVVADITADLAVTGSGTNKATVDIDFGDNDIYFSVTPDGNGSKVYYWVKWQRSPMSRPSGLSNTDVFVAPSEAGAATGKITGLKAEETYEYKLPGASE